MKRSGKLSPAVILGTIILSAVAVQATTALARGPVPFSTFDADGSGGISEEELLTVRSQNQAAVRASGRLGRGMADAPSFADIDTDNSGEISPEELTNYQLERRSGRGRGAGRGMGQGMGQGAGTNN